jgi:hypothetical protein
MKGRNTAKEEDKKINCFPPKFTVLLHKNHDIFTLLRECTVHWQSSECTDRYWLHAIRTSSTGKRIRQQYLPVVSGRLFDKKKCMFRRAFWNFFLFFLSFKVFYVIIKFWVSEAEPLVIHKYRFSWYCHATLVFLGVGWDWVHLARRPITGLLYQPRTIDDDCGAVGGMKTGRGNWSTRRKPTLVLLCPPQNTYNLTWARTRVAVTFPDNINSVVQKLGRLQHHKLKTVYMGNALCNNF